jgi:hypothetical protein
VKYGVVSHSPSRPDVDLVTDWCPVPFLDPDVESAGSIIVTCLVITAVFAVLAAGLHWWSGRRPSSAGPRTA